MLKNLSITAVAMFFAVVTAAGLIAAEPAKLVCPVSGQPVDDAFSVKFNDGNVKFCCAKCKAAFEKDSSKFAAKANLQLVASGQAVQKKCVFTGGPINAEKSIDVKGSKVSFCCGNCLAKAQKATPDELLTLTLADAPFKKGFEVTAK